MLLSAPVQLMLMLATTMGFPRITGWKICGGIHAKQIIGTLFHTISANSKQIHYRDERAHADMRF